MTRTPPAAASARPTNVRYFVLAALCSLSFVLYVDRVCISQAATSMQRDLGLSKSLMGYVFGAFTLAYGLFELPTGHWGDKYGARGVLTRIVVWWSIFTALTGCVPMFSWKVGFGFWAATAFNRFALLLIVRFLFGAGEAGALPNSARVLSRWLPADERAWAQGMVIISMQLGGAVAPYVTSLLIWLVDWRWAFILLGQLGIVWAIGFQSWFRDEPAEHSWTNEAEREKIRAGTASAVAAQDHPPIPWRLVLTGRNLWLMGYIQTCTAFAAYVNMFWLPTYLKQARLLDETQSGLFASAVMFGGVLGCLDGTITSRRLAAARRDDAAAHARERRWRPRFGMVGLSLSAAALVCSTFMDDVRPAVAAIGLASFCAMSQQANWWAVVSHISGPHLGALFGLMNSMGVAGAITSPILVGYLVEWRERAGFTGREAWDLTWWICAGVLISGAAAWRLVDIDRSLVQRPRDADAAA